MERLKPKTYYVGFDLGEESNTADEVIVADPVTAERNTGLVDPYGNPIWHVTKSNPLGFDLSQFADRVMTTSSSVNAARIRREKRMSQR